MTCIQMTQNLVFLSKTKHINIHVHHIKDKVNINKISSKHINDNINLTNIIIKPLSFITYKHCIQLLSM